MKRKIFTVIMLGITLFLITGCGGESEPKTAITTKDFIKKAEKEGLIVADLKDQFSTVEYIKEATTAASSDGWQVEFYVIDKKKNAKTMYESIDIDFQTMETKKRRKRTDKGKNFNKVEYDTDQHYGMITRVDNTIVYVKVLKESKKDVQAFIEKLGY